MRSQCARTRCDGTADAVARAANLIRGGAIIAVKGLGGYHLACDATSAEAVGRLRQCKRRKAKPFALMARDLELIRRYCSSAARRSARSLRRGLPIVLLDADGPRQLPHAVAPGLTTLGFMLPTTPLHLLLLQEMDIPLVMTSGNIAEEPPIIDDGEARERLAGIADYALVHDRRIANRVDNSVVRIVDGKCRVLRRSRGFAPSRIKLPAGFEAAPELTALGGELKATFCLVQDGQAILSQHQGDLENTATFDDYRKNLALYRQLFAHEPVALVIDQHPEYLSSKLGRAEAGKMALPLLEVQHHHAHVAACLAENDYPLESPLCSASSSTGSASAMTARSGEANSCSPIILAIDGLRGCSRSRCRAVPRRCANHGETLYAHLTELDWVGQADGRLFRARSMRLSEQQAAPPARCHDCEAPQCAARLLVRAPVRRGRRGARNLPRAAGL